MARTTKAEKVKNGANLGFEQTLWQAADKLRGNMDAAAYNHVPGTVGADLRVRPSEQDVGAGLASPKYEDITGFCKSATKEEIVSQGFALTPGRYVGAAPPEEGGEPFWEKMKRLAAQGEEQFAESGKLEAAIRENLARLGYPVKKEEEP